MRKRHRLRNSIMIILMVALGIFLVMYLGACGPTPEPGFYSQPIESEVGEEHGLKYDCIYFGRSGRFCRVQDTREDVLCYTYTGGIFCLTTE